MKTITATVLYSVHVTVTVEDNATLEEISEAIYGDANYQAFPKIGVGSYENSYITQCDSVPELNDVVVLP